MTPAGGQAVSIAPSEEVVLDAAAAPAVQSFVAPQLDDWDNWNYVRTDRLLDSTSSRYVGSDGLRRGRSRPLRQLARRPELRLRVGP